jgi:hypothetical protein
MTVDPQVKEIVAFVFLSNPDPKHQGEFIPQGTGFFIAVKSTKDPDMLSCYFVTAKHVFQTEDKKAWLSSVLLQ